MRSHSCYHYYLGYIIAADFLIPDLQAWLYGRDAARKSAEWGGEGGREDIQLGSIITCISCGDQAYHIVEIS